jgi:hypothetical protein
MSHEHTHTPKENKLMTQMFNEELFKGFESFRNASRAHTEHRTLNNFIHP